MDNVRQLSELAAGRVEHVQALARLSSQGPGPWRDIVAFLAEVELSPLRKIQLIRQLLHEFDACPDEPALKKRYLQLRVARAAAATVSLSHQDRQRQLEAQRTALAGEIAVVQSRISQLEDTMRRRTGRTLARAALDKRRMAVGVVRGDTATALQVSVQPLQLSLEPTAASVASLHNAAHSLVTGIPPCEREEVENLKPMDNRSKSVDNPKSVLADMSFDQAASGILRIMEQSLRALKPPKPQDFPVPVGVMSIQQVALLLSKLLVLLRSGSSVTAPDGQVKDILHQLQSVQDAAPQSTEQPGAAATKTTTTTKAALAKVQEALQRTDSQISQTSALILEGVQQSRDLLEALKQLLTSAEPLLLEAQAKIQREEEEGDCHPSPPLSALAPSKATPASLPAPLPLSTVVLGRLCPVNQRHLPAQLQQQSTALAERTTTMASFMNELQNRVASLERNFEQAAAAFSQECHALETLQDPPTQHIVSMVREAARQQ